MVQKLLDYQNQDAKLREIEKTLADSEDRKKALKAKKYIDGVVDGVNKLDDKATELIYAYEQASGEQLKLKEQQEELEHAIDESQDENAIAYLLKKVDELASKMKSLGDKVSAIDKEIQSVLKEYNAIKANTKVAQEQYAKYGAVYNELKKSLKIQKDEIEATLEKIKKDVDPSCMERYLKKRQSDKMYPVLYEVRGDSCGACNMELSAIELNKLKKGEIVDCGNCGRMLYRKN